MVSSELFKPRMTIFRCELNRSHAKVIQSAVSVDWKKVSYQNLLCQKVDRKDFEKLLESSSFEKQSWSCDHYIDTFMNNKGAYVIRRGGIDFYFISGLTFIFWIKGVRFDYYYFDSSSTSIISHSLILLIRFLLTLIIFLFSKV